MIVPRLHDRLLLGGTLAAATGTVLVRGWQGAARGVGAILLAAGLAALTYGIFRKIRSEK